MTSYIEKIVSMIDCIKKVTNAIRQFPRQEDFPDMLAINVTKK